MTKGVNSVETALWLYVPGVVCHLVVFQSSLYPASRTCLLQSNQFWSKISQAFVTLLSYRE